MTITVRVSRCATPHRDSPFSNTMTPDLAETKSGHPSSSEVAQTELGYDPGKHSVDDALKGAWEWFEKNGMI